jgi:hypothetical protein
VDSAKTYTFYAGDETTEKGKFSHLANQEGYLEATVDDLREYYEEAVNLQKTFNSFENYLAYMDEREALIKSGEYDPGTYGQLVDTGMVQNVDGTMINPTDIQNLSRNDFISKYGLDPSEVQIVQQETGADRASGYRDWLSSDPVQSLNQKYGIPDLRQTDDGREYMWNGTAWVKTKEPEQFGWADALKLATAVGFGALTGTALGGVLGSAGGITKSIATGLNIAQSTVGAFGGGALGSAVTQFVTSGEVDPKSMFISGVTAGILDAASVLGQGNYSDISSEAFNQVTSGPMSVINDKVWKVADALGSDFDTALDIVKGVSIGAIEGGDLEGIVTGAATTLGADKIASYLEDTVGLTIPNFFEEGTTTINREAVEEVSRIFLRDAFEGNVDEGTLLSMGLGYIREDGTFAFADPSSLFPDSGDFDIFDGFFDGIENPFDGIENPFEGFDFELKGGEGFDLDFTSNEAQALADSDTFGEYFDPNEYDNNVILQYDQGTVDSIMAIIEAAKEAGRGFDDSVLQPIKETIQEAGYAIDDNVLQPIKDGAIALYDMLPDVSIGGPNLSGPNLSGPNLPDLPDVDTGGFDFPDLKFGKPFGDELEGFNPFAAPAMGQEVPLLAKVKPQNAYDPRRAGSSIVSSMFAEYLG